MLIDCLNHGNKFDSIGQKKFLMNDRPFQPQDMDLKMKKVERFEMTYDM